MSLTIKKMTATTQMLLAMFIFVSLPVAAQVLQKSDTVTITSTSRMEREIEDKKDEIRQRKSTLRALTTVGDTLSTILSRINAAK